MLFLSLSRKDLISLPIKLYVDSHQVTPLSFELFISKYKVRILQELVKLKSSQQLKLTTLTYKRIITLCQYIQNFNTFQTMYSHIIVQFAGN